MEKLDQALVDFNRAIDFDSKDAQKYFSRGNKPIIP